jgi:hypothetical protein
MDSDNLAVGVLDGVLFGQSDGRRGQLFNFCIRFFVYFHA